MYIPEEHSSFGKKAVLKVRKGTLRTGASR